MVALFAAAPAPALASNADAALCDRLAAIPLDPDKPSDVQAVNQIAPENVKEAVRACEKAANAPGSARRMWTQYGRVLEFATRSGDALAAYEKAASQGSTMAMLGLFELYNSGKGVPQDNAKALSWLRKAADAGNAAAMNNLAAMYGLGAGVAKDAISAKWWYEKAASAGFAESMYQLGLITQEGVGAPQDAAAAKGWFEKAAALDHPDALYSLGLMAAEGRAGPKNEELAMSYLSRAATLGNEDAAKTLHRLACPFELKEKDGKGAGEICLDKPVPDLKAAAPR
jgi:TPR repeat protein